MHREDNKSSTLISLSCYGEVRNREKDLNPSLCFLQNKDKEYTFFYTKCSWLPKICSEIHLRL
jgi:hypothetical protein